MLDRQNHIQAIEVSRSKKLYDHINEYQTHVLETQGKAKYEEYIHSVKTSVFGVHNTKSLETERNEKVAKHVRLTTETELWERIMCALCPDNRKDITQKDIDKWYKATRHAKKHIKVLMKTIYHIQRDEWKNAKNQKFVLENMVH